MGDKKHWKVCKARKGSFGLFFKADGSHSSLSWRSSSCHVYRVEGIIWGEEYAEGWWYPAKLRYSWRSGNESMLALFDISHLLLSKKS